MRKFKRKYAVKNVAYWYGAVLVSVDFYAWPGYSYKIAIHHPRMQKRLKRLNTPSMKRINFRKLLPELPF